MMTENGHLVRRARELVKLVYGDNTTLCFYRNIIEVRDVNDNLLDRQRSDWGPRKYLPKLIESLELDLATKRSRKSTSTVDTDIPQLKSDVDWSRVIRQVEFCMNSVNKTGREPKDFKHYLFESVFEALYGPDIWTWYNKKSK
jgi:hypothetical protein